MLLSCEVDIFLINAVWRATRTLIFRLVRVGNFMQLYVVACVLSCISDA